MTSSPLFIRVAESTVIFGPIDQRGWFSACSTVTWSRSRSGCAQNGPPLAVITRRRTFLRSSPHRHCQMALCSESTGLMPLGPAARITSSPAITSTSLVARAISLPAWRAARVGGSARALGIATTTSAQRGSVTIASTLASKSASPACPCTRYSAVRFVDRTPSVKPKRWKRSGLRSMTSSVCWPIEPVAPSTTTLIGLLRGPRKFTAKPLNLWGYRSKDVEHRHVEENEDRGKQDRAEAVGQSPLPRDQGRRSLDPGRPLHPRF